MAESEDPTLLAELTLTRGLTIQMTAIGALGMVVGWTLFAGLFRIATGSTVSFAFVGESVGWVAMPLNVLVIVFLGTAFIVPHEWLHGLAIRYYGGTPRYGVGLAHFIMPYAYATTDHEFSRDQFFVVLLTPLLGMTAVGVPIMLAFEWGWIAIPLTLNAAGAVADVWMTVALLGYPADVRVVDRESGLRIYGQADDRPRGLSVTAVVWDGLAGAAIAVFASFLLLAFGGPIVLSALGIDAVTVGTPGRITHLISYTNTPDEISMAVGPGVLGLGGGIGLLFAWIRAYRRNRSYSADQA